MAKRASFLEENQEMEDAHSTAASAGQTEVSMSEISIQQLWFIILILVVFVFLYFAGY